MNEADALLELQSLCAASTAPTLDAADLNRLLRKWKKPPRFTGEPPRYDLDGAASDGWRLKAGKASALIATADGGQKLDLQQIFDHCQAMAAFYAPAFVV